MPNLQAVPTEAGPVAPAVATPSKAVRALERMSRAQLERQLIKGRTPAPDALAGWEFRGLNHPVAFRALGIRKFIKGFFWREESLFGYNCPVRQNLLASPWIARPTDDAPKRFGFYEVRAVDAAETDNRYLHALLLDYGRGGNPRFDPSAGLRDYLVQVDDAGDIYLGKAYYAMGPMRVSTNFFILERHRPGPTDVRLP